MIRSLRESGVAIIYITHKMDEVFRISDYVTVFRDGRHVATQPASELDRQKLITLMVGRELTHMFPKEAAEIGDVVMSVKGLTRKGTVNDISIHDISFDIRRGEILGLAGLMGAGRTEVLEAIFGVTLIDAGEIAINGRPVQIREPADAIHHGLGLLTEDRKLTGIMGVLSVGDNMTVASLDRYSPGG
jgi:inositol transport system ATP-binding protein